MMKEKECTCGIMRGIENGHNQDCPRYSISSREKKYYEAIEKALKKEQEKKEHLIGCNCQRCVARRGFVY